MGEYSAFSTILQECQRRHRQLFGMSEEQGADIASNRGVCPPQSLVVKQEVKHCEDKPLVDRMSDGGQMKSELANGNAVHQQEHGQEEQMLRDELALAKSKIVELEISEFKLKDRLLAAQRIIARLRRENVFHALTARVPSRAREDASEEPDAKRPKNVLPQI